MQLGIFAKTFPGDIEANLAAVAAGGFSAVQYNLSIAGLETVPESVPDDVLDHIAAAARTHGVELDAISGTFNAAHPDPAVRGAFVDRFPALARAAARLGVPVITLSSGSRDADDMWRHHPDNGTPEAWVDSRATLTTLAGIAEEHGVDIAVEPEHTNVVSTAALGARMLAEVGSERLKVVFDAANLLDVADLSEDTIRNTVDDALTHLGPHLALVHAKELVPDRAPVAPGEGVLPWTEIVSAVAATGYAGPLVVHGLDASATPIARATLAPLLGEGLR